MQFGQPIAVHIQQGTVAPPQTTLLAEYLCEGSSCPNPGATKMVLHDETDFMKLDQRDGTNHRAIYNAVAEALKDAGKRNATDVHISLASRLVWGQITGNQGVKKLEGELTKVARLASRFRSVTWHLVEPPFTVSVGSVATLRALRRMAP